MIKTLKHFSDEKLVTFLLYGSKHFTFSVNGKNLNHAIKFLKANECSILFKLTFVNFSRATIILLFLQLLYAEDVVSVTFLNQTLCPVWFSFYYDYRDQFE